MTKLDRDSSRESNTELRRNPGLKQVACYRRTIGASLERVWENVLDWEHLPYLHSRAFAEIECQEAGAWGWRAQVVYPGGTVRSRIELLTACAENQYLTRVVDGPGAGNEIWTRLTVDGSRSTKIAVEFWLDLPAGVDADSAGQGYLALYRELWDEDEEMMQLRQSELDRLTVERGALPASRDLGTLEALRRKLPITLDLATGRFRIVEDDGELRVHSMVCPHTLGPLRQCDDEPHQLRCPWHGYRFDWRNGKSCDGRGLRLAPAPELVIDPETTRVRLAGTRELENL